MRHFRHSEVGLPNSIGTLPIRVPVPARARPGEPPPRFTHRALAGQAAAAARTVALAAITARAEQEDLPAGRLAAHDEAKGVHVPDDRSRRKVDLPRDECDTPRVASRPGERPEGSEMPTPGLRFLRGGRAILPLRRARGPLLGRGALRRHRTDQPSWRAHALPSAPSKFTRFQMSGDIPGVTTLSRRALLCFRGGFLSRRRSRSRSSPGPGSSVGRGPAASLGGWFVGGLRRRRLPARWRTLRVNSHRGRRSWLSTSIGGAGAFAGVGIGGGRACDGPLHLERKRGEVARALISAPVGESGLYARSIG